MKRIGAILLLLSPLVCARLQGATPLPTPAQRDFFEQRIRPMLANECYECHGAQKQKGKLRVDFRDGLLKGGDSGPAIIPGDAKKSLLIQSIRHEDPDSAMPKDRPKLSDSVIADFAKWINDGATDPRDAPPSGVTTGNAAWEATFAARKEWWSFKPVQKSIPPAVTNAAWSAHPVDHFLLTKIEERGLQPAALAGRRTLIRRVTFALTGLPPTPDEVRAFLEDTTPDAYAKVVDRLLNSPRFGEHWARHWMDLMRFAETHGSEGDPEIPNAWRYRDYLIRAFNADVPCDQLIREHLAGDLLAKPRWSETEGINESLLGLAHFRLVEHGFNPVDTLDEQIKTVDSQIDVVSKAFQGLTTSCARCHNHKFDPISERDYYALHGIFASVRPTQLTVDQPERLRVHRGELEKLKREIKAGVAQAWEKSARELTAQLRAGDTNRLAMKNENHPLAPWFQLRDQTGDAFTAGWQSFVQKQANEAAARRKFNAETFQPAWDFRGDGVKEWFCHGVNPPEFIARPGEFGLEPEGEKIFNGLWTAGVFTHRLSQKHNGVFASPRFKITSDSISVRVVGGKGAGVRLVLDNYPLGQGNIYPAADLQSDAPTWVRIDTAYRKGGMAYLEFATAEEVTSRVHGAAGPGGRSFFGVERAVLHDAKTIPKDEITPNTLLAAGDAPKSAEALAERLGEQLTAAITAWRNDSLNEEQRVFLDAFLRGGLLPVTVKELPEVASLVAGYRKLEADIPAPRRAPGVLETVGYNAPLLSRGDHLKPLAPEPRGYLQLVSTRRYDTKLSGRLELANDIASAANPLTARVLVNRVWHHLFGRGLVATVDNFGRLGEKPSHPELLDFLATRFVEQGWSSKDLIRYLVTTSAYQMSSEVSARAGEIDPDNLLLSHARTRRLEAESIRDGLLAVSGRLDTTMYGPGANALAAPDQQRRRSVYLMVRRNFLSAFLETFDAPRPFTTLGKREATNVPAQSLALLNDPFVIEQAAQWADVVLAAEPNANERARRMFDMAFARPPSEAELTGSRAYLADLAREHGEGRDKLVWRDFAQSLFNLKEFIYVR